MSDQCGGFLLFSFLVFFSFFLSGKLFFDGTEIAVFSNFSLFSSVDNLIF